MNERILPVEKKLADSTISALEPILDNLLELYTHVKSAHWNLRDENFIAIHRLLDEVAEEVDESADSVAERIRQLGQPVNAPSQKFSTKNSLPKFPAGELSAPDDVLAICNSMKAAISSIREGIKATSADDTDEPITADLLTRISGELEKYLWVLNSHL
jgi:starvation-inducible DNA-binding protein